jgi:hypothetical protein
MVAALVVIYGVPSSIMTTALATGCGLSVLPLLLWLRYICLALIVCFRRYTNFAWKCFYYIAILFVFFPFNDSSILSPFSHFHDVCVHIFECWSHLCNCGIQNGFKDHVRRTLSVGHVLGAFEWPERAPDCLVWVSVGFEVILLLL